MCVGVEAAHLAADGSASAAATASSSRLQAMPARMAEVRGRAIK